MLKCSFLVKNGICELICFEINYKKYNIYLIKLHVKKEMLNVFKKYLLFEYVTKMTFNVCYVQNIHTVTVHTKHLYVGSKDIIMKENI